LDACFFLSKLGSNGNLSIVKTHSKMRAITGPRDT
jgi:hypothetical protein